jgi:hypothetical protein
MVKLGGCGWRRVRLDTGEVVEVWTSWGDCPERIEWPAQSGRYCKIAEVLDKP